MVKGRMFSGIAITDKTGVSTRCRLCGERIMKGITAWKFAWIEPRRPMIDFQYTCILCADRVALNKAEQSTLTEEQVRKIWDGVEAIMRERIRNAG